MSARAGIVVTGTEVLAQLRRLNAEQKQTIILVTHDPSIAAVAPRLVTVKDGLIWNDVRRRPDVEQTAACGGAAETRDCP